MKMSITIEMVAFVLALVLLLNSLIILRYARRTIDLENRVGRLEGKN